VSQHGYDNSPSQGTSRHFVTYCPKILQYIQRGTVTVNTLAQEHKDNEVAPARSSTDLHCLLIISLHVIH